MFSYYGSKGKIVNYYPPPKHNKIIEPFAGSARYSLKYFENDVLLVDKSEAIINVWNYLINATEKDILSLPDIYKGDNLKNFNISEEERFIIYCCATGGGGGDGRGYQITSDEDGFNLWNRLKIKISKELFKIKHWKILHASYEYLENENATWFIDPPYKFGGHKYKESNKKIDFDKLGKWCKNRNGQVIVCENTKADWLPFKPMIDMQGIMFKTTEAIWSNHKTNYDAVQQTLNFEN